MAKAERSLYQCGNAKVRRDRLVCGAGHKLDPRTPDGGLPAKWWVKGEPLIISACQSCPDYDHMGDQPDEDDRGFARFEEKHYA